MLAGPVLTHGGKRVDPYLATNAAYTSEGLGSDAAQLLVRKPLVGRKTMVENGTIWLAKVGLIAAAINWTFAGEIDAQSVSCLLAYDASGSFAGDCRFGTTTRQIELDRASGPSDALWVGSVSDGTAERPIQVATYQYSNGPQLVVRTSAWHILKQFSYSGEGLALAWDEEVEAPPSEIDLEILQIARNLLRNAEMWDRDDDRNCENDMSLISVYCALARATREAMGSYQHRQPAMQAVRRVIASEWRDRIVNHRLMNFNNDTRTTLADVRRLFDLAEESLRRSVR